MQDIQRTSEYTLHNCPSSAPSQPLKSCIDLCGWFDSQHKVEMQESAGSSPRRMKPDGFVEPNVKRHVQ